MNFSEKSQSAPDNQVAWRRVVCAVWLKIGHLALPSAMAVLPSSWRPRASPGLFI